MLSGVTAPLRTHRIHPAWWVAAVTFLALVGAAAFRAVPGVLIDPLRDEFGWSVSTISAAVAVNMALYGLTAPFAAALMERFGIRRVVMCALLVVALGSGLTVFMTTSWQLILLWGVLVGLGTGSMALSLVATVTGRWFVARRGLVSGILTAGSAAGQLIFLPLVAWIDSVWGWRAASLGTTAAALAVLPLVAWLLRDRPRDLGVTPYGGTAADDVDPVRTGAARNAVRGLVEGAKKRGVLAARRRLLHLRDVTNGLVQPHFIPAAHDHGMPVTTAAGLLAVVGLFDIAGTIFSGWLTDRPIRGCCSWPTTGCAGCRCSRCRRCSARTCRPAWSRSSSSTAWTGWPPCRRPWRCAASTSAPARRSSSAGSSPRTSWARRWRRSAGA